MGRPNQDHALHDIRVTVPKYASMNFGDTGFRFVRIDALSGELSLHNVIAVYERRGEPQLGKFISSDPLLNRIFDTCVHTIRLNMQDYIYDGVKRDRLVWGGDMNFSVVSMIRRGSVIVSFLCGAMFFREKNLKAKGLDLALVLLGMIFLYIGSR